MWEGNILVTAVLQQYKQGLGEREQVYKRYCLFPVVWCLWGCKSLYGFYPQLLLIEMNAPSGSPLANFTVLPR